MGAVNCPVLHFHSPWGPPNQLSPSGSCSPFLGSHCSAACGSATRGARLDPSSAAVTHPFWVIFFPWRQLKHPCTSRPWDQKYLPTTNLGVAGSCSCHTHAALQPRAAVPRFPFLASHTRGNSLTLNLP